MGQPPGPLQGAPPAPQPPLTYSERMASLKDDANYILNLCQQLGIPGLTDIHTHFMPHNVLRKVWAYFEKAEDVLGYDPTDSHLDPVWGMIAEAELPIVIHAGHAPQGGAHTGIEPIRDVLRRFPNLTLVMAHLGMPDYEAFLDLADEHPKFHLDTCMALTDFTERFAPTSAEYRRRLGDYGDRIVFASDFPNIPYSYAHQVEALERLELGGGVAAGRAVGQRSASSEPGAVDWQDYGL